MPDLAQRKADECQRAVADYPRMDDRFVEAPFGTDRYEVEADEFRLVLDFATNKRTALRLPPEH